MMLKLKIHSLSLMLLVAIVVTIVLTLFVGGLVRTANEAASKQPLNILARIEDQGVLVTRTIYSDQEQRIKIDRGSSWNEFLWGKEIVASARVRTDIGVDLKAIKAEQITTNDEQKLITITGVSTQILDSSVQEKLTVNTEGTILSRLFDKDTNSDYQLAATELTKQARSAIEADGELLEEAKRAAEVYLNALFASSGYKVKLA